VKSSKSLISSFTILRDVFGEKETKNKVILNLGIMSERKEKPKPVDRRRVSNFSNLDIFI